MKVKLKNNATDIVLFIAYHLIAVVGTLAFFIVVTQGLDNLNIDSLKNMKIMSAKTIFEGAAIEGIRGNVNIILPGMHAGELAKNGTQLKQGSRIETGEKSSAVIRFGKNYSCRIRIGAKTIVNLDTLLARTEDKSNEISIFNLMRGGMYLLLRNDSKEADIKIRSLATVYAIRGTNLAVISDGEKKSMLTVAEGTVESENIRTNKLSMVPAGSTYYADIQGNEKMIADPEIIKRFDFEGKAPEILVPDVEEISLMMGEEPAAIVQVTEDPDKDLKAAITQEVSNFKTSNELMATDLETERNEFSAQIQKFNDEKPKLSQDINCIENSATQCKLYSEQLLQSRGFPRTFGDPRVRRSLITDLRLYMTEQEKAIADREELIKNTEELLVKRLAVLEWAEEALSNNTELQSILPKLQDRRLDR